MIKLSNLYLNLRIYQFIYNKIRDKSVLSIRNVLFNTKIIIKINKS